MVTYILNNLLFPFKIVLKALVLPLHPSRYEGIQGYRLPSVDVARQNAEELNVEYIGLEPFWVLVPAGPPLLGAKHVKNC